MKLVRGCGQWYGSPSHIIGIIRKNHDIKKCFDEVYDEFLISDELKKASYMTTQGQML